MRRSSLAPGGYHLTAFGRGLLAALLLLGALVVAAPRGGSVLASVRGGGVGDGPGSPAFAALPHHGREAQNHTLQQDPFAITTARALLEQQPSADRACSLPPRATGPCRGALARYSFDQQTGKCELFSWGGCDRRGQGAEAGEEGGGGSIANRWSSEQACREACVEVVEEGAAAGPTTWPDAVKALPSTINVTTLPATRVLASQVHEPEEAEQLDVLAAAAASSLAVSSAAAALLAVVSLAALA
jgi:hypothetical protein